MSLFRLNDNLKVPAELAALHATRTKQSIQVLIPNSSSEAKLIRLFLGTASLVHIPTGKVIRQDINYSVLGCPIVRARSYKKVETLLVAYDMTTEEVDHLLKKTLDQDDYYTNLLEELQAYLWRTRLEQHTLAFLHIYRFLEHISFAFPLLFIAKSTNYSNAFTELKSFLSDSDKKELAFFKRFVESSIDLGMQDQSNLIKFGDIDSRYRSAIFSAIKSQIPSDSIESSVPDTSIEMKNKGILELCINLRNRYFHFIATNPKNIATNKIGDPDWLFSRINQPILNWLVMVYFETLRHRISGIA